MPQALAPRDTTGRMLLLASSVRGLFKWRQFEPEVILLAVGWYLRFSLSYRDVEELLAERGLLVDHVTVWRWVQSYAPEIQRRLRPRLRPTNGSWRVDETYIRVKGEWRYLYWAVDSSGATIDLATTTDFIKMPEQVGGIFVNPCGTITS
jgi:transposase-like protein